MNPQIQQQLLQQIAAIPTMERGKLSAYSFKDRGGASGPYHKLQFWENGKNNTRYIPADQVPDVQAALAGYAAYQQLTAEYAQTVIAETRQHLGVKKKHPPRPRSAWPRKRKSNN